MLEMLWSFLKKLSFHNFSSSSMYILLNKYFCCKVFKKPRLLFWQVAVNTFTFLCVYDMRIVLLKLNGEMLMKWLSEQFWRWCSCVYVLIETSHTLQCVCVCVCVCVVKESRVSLHYVTLDHKTSLKSLEYICSNNQKYIVCVKIINFI